jgi:hyaluronate lyase
MQRKGKMSVGKFGIGLGSVLLSLLFFGNSSSAEETSTSSDTTVTTEQISEIASVEESTEVNLNEKTNLIQNGAFENTVVASGNWSKLAALTWENPWIPAEVDKKNGAVSVEEGRLSIRAIAAYRVALGQVLVVDSSNEYILEYDVETKEVKGSGVRARVRALDETGKEVNKDFLYTDFVSGTNNAHIQRNIVLPQGTKKVKVELFFENSVGEAWFDNVSLKESIKPEESNSAIENPQVDKSSPESGVVRLMSNKVYLPARKDLRYEITNPSIARLENQMIYPLAAGSTEISVYEGDEKRSNFTLEVSPYTDTVFRQVRENWEVNSLSNKSYNPADEHMKAFLGTLETGVADSLTKWVEPSLATKTIFSDIDFTSSKHLTTAYRRLEQMAQVFENPGSQFYRNRDLLEKIRNGMAWLNTKVYNEQKEISDNWWDYEIGTPRAIVDILIYLHPYFSQEEINKYTAPISKFVPNVSMIRSTTTQATPAVGGNQTDLSKVAILEGALREDSQRIRDGVHGLSTILKFVDKGEGFYEDGSYIDHTNVAYTGAYGNVLIDGFSQLLPVVQSTEFALDSNDLSILYEWIDRAYAPILVKGELMDMTRGRSISRATSQSHVQAVEILRSLARLAEASSNENKVKLRAIVKGHLQSDSFYSAYNNLKSYRDIELFNQILSDTTISPVEYRNRIAAFNNMDKFVYHNAQSDYAFGISMYSSRTQNYEDMNNENRRGWYTSDGMVYLYNGDLGHYSQDYWATVDPYRLPGTTVTNDMREDGSGEVTLKSGFVGATQLDSRLATVAMDFNNWNDSLQARKAWFIIGDKLVFLGTDVQHSSDKGAVTTIENRKLSPGQNYTYYLNGAPIDLSKDVVTDKTQSFYMTNGDIKQSIGYVFLNDLSTHAQVEERSGKWSDINHGQSSAPVQNRFLSLWHEQSKESSHYAYVMIPNKSMEEMQELGKAVSVQHQDKDLQVVYDRNEKVWGIVKYVDGDYSLNDDVKLTKAGLYTVQELDNGYRVSYYNPETKSTEQPVYPMSETTKVSLEVAATMAAPSSIWTVQVAEKSSLATTTTSEITSTQNSSSQANSPSTSDATTNSEKKNGSVVKLPQTGEKKGILLSLAGFLVFGLVIYFTRKKKTPKA